MGKWKDAFLKSLDPKFETLEKFAIGPPAADADLIEIESALGANLPPDFIELLREFNGIEKVHDGANEPYYFDTKKMLTAGDYYRDWGNDLALQWFKNIVWVCQENGFAQMWAVVAKPFATFQFGDVVSFDHDRLMYAASATDLFVVNCQNLQRLVEAQFKDAG